nr:ankyrin repeat-containing protein npr4 [Quercus suber]
MRNDENSGFSQYLSFEKHIRKGNWDAAMQFINSHPEAVSARISFLESTALHIAIFEGHTNIVEELVKIMSEENLKIKDTSGFTVLGHCAMAGNIQMAKCIIGKSRSLLSIGNGIDDLIPVVLAIACNHSGAEMARYLYSETPLEDLMPRNGINGATFITWAIYSKAIDMALNLLDSYPELAITLDCYGQSPVQVLAGMSFAYRSGNQLVCWKQWIYNSICIPPAHDTNQIPISVRKSEMEKCDQARNIKSEINQIYELKLLHHQSKKLLLRMCEVLPGLNFQQLENGKVIEAMIKAVKQGKVEFVTEMLKACPGLVFCYEKSTERDLFKLAVLYRQGERCAMFEPSARRNTVPGAAFLMQREVQWYKELESIVRPSILENTNKNVKRPQELFTESHKELVKEGEKWMKGTASSCTVVAALIVTIMFAAAITVPGGNKQDLGLPTFLNEKVFMVFIISDALSLLSASTSLLMFLGILTSRYAEEDFLKSLPKKMIVGLSTLIFSIAAMMITFCASLFIILPGKSWVVILVICLASVPVILFTWMQFHLLIDMVISTYGSRIINKEAKYGS